MVVVAIVAGYGAADSIDTAMVVAALYLDIAGDVVVAAGHDVVVLTAHDALVGVVVANEPSAVGDVAVVDDFSVVGVARDLADHNCKVLFAWR